MAEENQSKYLKFQDTNGDGLNDKCDDIIDVIPVKKCPACVPNPNYVTPSWRNLVSTQPWFNEKYCKFQVAVQTKHKSIATANMSDIFDEYKDEAIDGLILGFNKADTDEVRKTIGDNLVQQKYELNPRPHSFLKLLYSIPYDDFAPLPLMSEDEEEEEDQSEPEDVVVEYAADLIFEKLVKVRKAFHLYSRLHRVYSYVEKGKIVFVESNKLYSVKQFDRYGDIGIFPDSYLAQLLTTLDGFLRLHGKDIVGVGGISFNKDRVTKIEFTFTSKYRLKKLRVWTVGCGGKPFVYKKKRLRRLNNTNPWKDRTAVAYFAQLDSIDRMISAREAPYWLDVIKEHTYPAVYNTKNWPPPPGDAAAAGESSQTALSCMADSLTDSLGELGQDIMDDVLGLGDALAYQFNKNICAKSMDEFIEQQFKFGMVMDPNELDPETGKLGAPKNIMQFATEQAFKQLQDDEQIFVMICARMLQSAAGDLGLMPAGGQKFLDELHADGLDRLKLCGLFNLLMDAIMCLLGGLSLEEALASIIKSALKAMSIDNLGAFFIGLPPEKQAELEALVMKKINEGDIFKDPSGPAASGGPGVASDLISGKLKFTPPWKRDKSDTRNSSGGDPDTLTKDRPATMSELQQTSQLERRTLAQQFDIKNNAENELSDNVIIEAYIKALIEVYSDDLLSVVDMLNKLPGAAMIARVIALLDCPRPPILKPSIMDFIRSIDIPWCRNLNDLVLPKLFNPFGWIPKLSDITYILWYIMKLLIQRLIIMIIIKILVKLCEIIGDAICKALETLGDIAKSLPAIIGGRTTFSDVIRDSICGTDATDQQIEDTTTELFEKLGVGGAALADKDAVMAFTGDLSSAVTRTEMFNAFLGDMSSDMATAAYNLIQFDYPQFAEAFPTKDSIADFVANVGTLIPEDVKQTMRDFMEDLPDDDPFPANPTLCATPEQLEDFQELRCSLLEGRATPEQCRTMFDNLQDDLQEDLEALSTAMQKGILPEDLLPPIVSSPGCDDGLVPFESPEQQVAVSSVLTGELQRLKREYTEDMLGDGGFFGLGQYGLLNMILCDTMGQPLTVHWRKAARNPSYVDFVTDTSKDAPDDDDENNFLFFFRDPSPTLRQRGNFPDKVASWMQTEMQSMDVTFNSTNDWQKRSVVIKSFEELGFNGLFGGTDIDKISIPDMGYNVKLKSDLGIESMRIIRLGRKRDADIVLNFRDNNKGRRTHIGTDFAYGFDINAYYYDLEKSDDTDTISCVGTNTAPLDSVRIDLVNVLNPFAAFRADLKNLMSGEEWVDYITQAISGEISYIEDRLYEFLAVDNTFNNFPAGSYPQFSKCFNQHNEYSPPVYLISDVIKNNQSDTTAFPTFENIKNHIDSVQTTLFENFKNEIYTNEQAFKFGARYDTLVEADAEYVVKEGQTESPAGTLYSEAEIRDDGELRTIRNSDMIMGISRDQLERGDDARVYYLDPTTFGGSYTNPAVYIKPIQNEGYLGMLDIMFPDFSPCKPRNTDLIDFSSIAKEVKDTYNQIPEDDRLRSDPDCVTEVPYNRILTRQGKAGIEGMIKAACRIFASVHYVKSYATFSTFNPDFDNVFGPVFASYVVENMEKTFKDAQGAAWEFFNTFKDDEFWYAFLEQAVQTYGRQVDAGIIVNPPQHVLEALFRINDAQENYVYPRITDSRNDVRKAFELEETNALWFAPFKSRGLRTYRDEKKFDFVQATEEDAKIVLTEFVIDQLKFISNKFTQNMGARGIKPKINNLYYYILTNMTQGSETLDVDKEIVEEVMGLESSGDSLFTKGGELSLPTGEEYVGYYHAHVDQDDNVIYMVGERHSDDDHDILTPFANRVVVPIGDVEEYNSGQAFVESTEKPFILEKYISLNGVKRNPTTAINIIKQNDAELNISDVYPGDSRLVYPLDQQGVENTTVPPVGMEGSLGARYGLAFSTIIGGKKFLLCETEMDMLDLKVGQAAPFEANSKLLLCMINQLVAMPEMKYIFDGAYGVKKVTSILAVYNDMAFLPSIGEETVVEGATKPSFPDFNASTFQSKPGMKVTFPNAPNNWDADYSNSNAAWAAYSDRQIFTPFNLDWDDWDQLLLKSCKSRIKKIFKRHYYKRKFNAEDEIRDLESQSEIVLRNMKARFTPATGKRVLPWFRRIRLRDNPFNANGEICKKPEN